MHIVAKTDVGLVRKRNEDYFVMAPEQSLVVLCDGMGGHPGGDLASRMAAEEVQRTVEQDDSGEAVDGSILDVPALQPFVALIRGVFAADRKLRAYGKKHVEFQGMGTTLAALQEHAGTICAVHVGDSRIYSYRRGKLTQLTQDHSVVATLPESARASFVGMRNILTRAVGVGDELEVDFTLGPIQEGETFLLCSDGLYNFVAEERLIEILASDLDREACLQTLIDDANAAGGGDNITLALVWSDAAGKGGERLRGAVFGGPTGLRVEFQK